MATLLASSPRPSLACAASQGFTGSLSSLSKVSGIASLQTKPVAAGSGLTVGDRVLVSGSKSGILKYVGETDFAKGTWAGIALDDALGKNDGAVAGKR